MRWLMRRRHGDDRGAMTVLVALVTVGVLLGAGALVLNTGAWYSERAQLQNGADAGALAVADTCAAGTCQGAYASSTDVAPAAANHNANDGATTVDYVCGGTTTDSSGSYGTVTAIPASGGTLAACGPTLPNWTSTGCPAAPSTANVNFVNVHTSTANNTGNTIPVIGALTGNSRNIKACAQVTWGYPGGGKVVPFTISECEWYRDTHNGQTFAAEPPYLTAPTNTPWPPMYNGPSGTYSAKNPAPPTYGGEDVLSLHGTASVLSGGYFDSGGLDSWAPNPTPAKGGPTLSNDPAFFQDGTGSLKIAWSANNAGVDQALDSKESVTLGVPYTLTGWVYGAVGSAPVRLAIQNSNGTPNTAYTQTVAANGTWQLLTLQDASGNPTSFTPSGNQVDIWLESTAATTATQVTWLDTVNLVQKNAPGCTSQENPPSGFDMPGGFGWMNDASNNCSVTITPNQTVPDNTGASMDPACQGILQSYSCNPSTQPTPPCQPQVLLVPIYDGYCGVQSGCVKNNPTLCGALPPQSNGCYHIGGFGAFVPTGFNLTGSGGITQNSSIPPNKAYCKGSAKCVYGFFTRALIHDPNITLGGGGNKGAVVMGLSG